MNRRYFIQLARAGMGLVVTSPEFSRIPFSMLLPDEQLAFASPESQGVDSEALVKFITAANASGIAWHSIAIARHNKTILSVWWKPFGRHFVHSMYSISKSFTSAAIGLLISEGKLDIEQPVVSYFPTDLPADPDTKLARMKITHLLTMTTGHKEDSLPAFFSSKMSWIKNFFSQRLEFEPGGHFVYNTGATYILSALVTRITGQTLDKYLAPRLFSPMKITGYDWQQSPEGISIGGYGLRLHTEDILRFGQLLLQQGRWNGKQLLPERWVKDAVSKQVDSIMDNGPDWVAGYGFQFWRNTREGFRADGRYGQYMIDLPDKDIVIAVTGEIPGMQKALDLIWDHVFPALYDKPLPENAMANKKLRKLLDTLQLPVIKGTRYASLQNLIHNKAYKINANAFGVEQLRWSFSDKSVEMQIYKSSGKNEIHFDWEGWKLNDKKEVYPFPMNGFFSVPSLLAGSATWIDQNTLDLEIKLVECMQGDRLTCRFEGQRVTVNFSNSIGEKTMGYDDAPESRAAIQGSLGA